MLSIEHILKQPSEVELAPGVQYLSSICLPEQISLSPATMCTLSLSAAAEGDLWCESQTWCCLLLSIFKRHCLLFSSLLLAVGRAESIPVQMKSFFFFSICFVLFCLPQTHGHLAYAVCSLCRNCQRANKARGHAWAEQSWWLGIQSIHWSLGQAFRSNGFFDSTDCRNSRSCHV